jgi:polysaccharide export outer membrane protein
MSSRAFQRLPETPQGPAFWRVAATVLISLFVVNAFVYAQGTAAQGTAASTPSVRLVPRPASATPLTIESGDAISVQVFNTPELSANHRVGPEGEISLPGAGAIKVTGLTPLQAGSAIEKLLHDSQIMLDPHVSVTVTEYTTEGITVLGEVKSPGTYPLLGRQSLYTALAAAGGVTPHEGSTITINHRDDPEHPKIVRVDASGSATDQQLTLVQPGDIVLVSKAGAIYVIGDVAHPGEYFISNSQPLRALNAVALAEGLRDTAAASHASIIRTNGDGAETIPVNLAKVAKNEAPDPVLQPSDILVVPPSGFKEFMKIALPGVTGAAANAAALALISH